MPFEDFAAEMRSDKQRAIKLLAMLNKVASGLGSMHWTLVRCDEPIITTGDHPVCLVPLLDDGHTRVRGRGTNRARATEAAWDVAAETDIAPTARPAIATTKPWSA